MNGSESGGFVFDKNVSFSSRCNSDDVIKMTSEALRNNDVTPILGIEGPWRKNV